MSDSSADRDPLDRLAEEFVGRFRRGERPSLTEYANRLPDRADEVRDLFPALVEMEQLKPVTADHTGAFVPSSGSSDPDRVGEFRILRRVGVGGMGVVYEAVQESLGRHVALKLLPIDALADPKRLERFRREAKAAAKLHHTNVVPVFGTGEADGRHYYAMQFIAGHPLDAVIEEVRGLKEQSAAPGGRAVSEVAAALVTGTFTNEDLASRERELASRERERPEESGTPPVAHAPGSPSTLSDGGRSYWATVARVGEQVADALAYAHGQGVLHRDIKPANLLLDLRGTVWVTDFGLAKSTDADDLTHAGDFVGTLRYMAPERFDGSGDNRADVYALGLTLYELLTLKPAFTADSRAKLVEQVIAASPPAPRSINPVIPRDLETIVLKAIQRDPASRYPTAAAMADDLRRFTEDRPIFARRASAAEQAWRWCRRNPAVASLVAAVLLVSVAGATVASLIAREQGRTAGRLEDTLAEKAKTADELDKTLAAVTDQKQHLERQQAQIRRDLYTMQINQAQASLVAGRPLRTEENLRAAEPKAGEPDLRNWEWHYLNRVLQPDRTIKFDTEDDGAESSPVKLRTGRAGGGQMSADGSRVFLWYSTDTGQFCVASDAVSGRVVGRLPKTGVFPHKDPRGTLLNPTLTLSPDGRHAFVGQYLYKPRGESASGPGGVRARTRDYVTEPDLWTLLAVDTGEPIPIPPTFVRQFRYSRTVRALGPGAAWLTVMNWDSTKPVTDEDDEFIGVNTVVGTADVTCSRWVRERAGDFTTVPTFTVGKGGGQPVLAADGRFVFWSAVPVRPFAVNGDPPPKDEGMWFECWDVTGSAARQLGKRFQLETGTTAGPISSRSIMSTFSPDGSKVAYLNPANEVVIHRTDGEFVERIAVPGLPRSNAGPGSLAGRNLPFRVTDAGNRVVVRMPTALIVAQKSTGGTVTSWQRPVVDRTTNSMPGGGVLTDDSGPGRAPTAYGHLVDGGKMFVEFDPTKLVLRAWDVSQEPGLSRTGIAVGGFNRVGEIEREGTLFGRVATPDGRITLDYPTDRELAPNPAATAFSEAIGVNIRPRPYTAGPVTVRDAAGKVLGTLPDPVENSQIAPVAPSGDGRRLIVRFVSTIAAGPVTGNQVVWKLYDLGSPIRVIDSGNTSLTAATQSGREYLIEIKSGVRNFGPNNSLPAAEFVRIRDWHAGQDRERIAVPGRHVHFCGYDPTGRWFLYESVDEAANPRLSNSIPTDEVRKAASALTGAVATAEPRRWRTIRPPLDVTKDPVVTALAAVGGSVAAGLPSPTLRMLRSRTAAKVWPVRLHLVDTATRTEKTWDLAPDAFGGVVAHAQFSPDGGLILFRYDRLLEPEEENRSGRTARRPIQDRLWLTRTDGTGERDVVLREYSDSATSFGMGRVGGPTSGSGRFAGKSNVVCSPDGRHLAAAGDSVVQVLDLETLSVRHTLTGHTGANRFTIAMAYNADGSRLFTTDGSRTSSAAPSRNQVHVWDTVGGRELLSLDAGETLMYSSALAFADGKLSLQVNPLTARVFDGTPAAK